MSGAKMNTEWIALGISILGFLASVYYSGRTSRKSDMEDAVKRAEANTKISTKLDGIAADVKDTARNVDKLREEIAEHGSRLAAVEQSAKSAHHRINELIELHNHYCGKDNPYKERRNDHEK